MEEREVSGRLYFLPERFNLTGHVDTEVRARGIYQARLYKSDSQVSGQILVPANYGIDENLADYRFEAPFLAVGISDIRGIGNALKLRLNGQTLDFQPGSGDRLLAGACTYRWRRCRPGSCRAWTSVSTSSCRAPRPSA
ncbi:Inner membrane protein CreD [compost metagenome]